MSIHPGMLALLAPGTVQLAGHHAHRYQRRAGRDWCGGDGGSWLQRMESNHRVPAYEAGEPPWLNAAIVEFRGELCPLMLWPAVGRGQLLTKSWTRDGLRRLHFLGRIIAIGPVCQFGLLCICRNRPRI